MVLIQESSADFASTWYRNCTNDNRGERRRGRGVGDDELRVQVKAIVRMLTCQGA